MKRSAGFIEEELYKKFVEFMPILTVDLILQDRDQKFILVKRTNEPLKNMFWTPGGRILKGEMCTDAAVRKCKEEIGLDTIKSNWEFLGILEDNYRSNNFNLECSTHTVSMVLQHQPLIDKENIILDNQSSEFKSDSMLPTEFIHHFSKSLVTLKKS